MQTQYDIIVVGAGHAGCEAANAAANMGCKVLLITMNMTTIAQMSCNPAMGGVAKGQIVREIDALGGLSGIITDKTMIQFRMLNRSKGPAMWSPRAQSDRMRFAEEWRLALETNPNIDFWQDMVQSLLIKDFRVQGVRCAMGKEFFSKAVILTNGTFLNGLIHVGEKKFSGGRSGEKAATGLTEQLISLGFETGRMKTGTPPRIDGRTIDYSRLEIQHGDEPPGKFSFTDTPPLEHQIPCHIGYTNKAVHALIADNIHKSPMYNGQIQSVGPRYCPSIEDKIVRFSDKERHQLFIEPEGRRTIEVYLNGFSSSLPEEIQYKALRQIEGFENAKMFRPGYAIEYDYFPPHQLRLTLETQAIENLYFAGQINGTTGYEEAAAQGIMAGINAALKIQRREPLILKRNQAYIGVLIDDLINKGTQEPYRMFTSRAEYRILLRQDNADLRLTEIGYRVGTISEQRYQEFLRKKQTIEELMNMVKELSISPEEANPFLETLGESPLKQKIKVSQLLLRPNISLEHICKMLPTFNHKLQVAEKEVKEEVEIQVKYQGYIERESEMAKKLERLEEIKLPENFNYYKLQSLSNEAKEKLNKIKPQTLGQASRISGVSPADISVLMIYMGR
ncbi:MAG: tRNA uridine-5-carboxymethylaminomethyl(34) synthesis enzyme MnmG [Bacteroidia bacterium]|nr:tRNA uridine-5-carboxymethylaminomethyl(34) synthesis enzyme MnmG [Bacteroidia bacterium]MDW8157721.1 tRNA uridine-5-carboxymethylaminomethyl(34) synthesis enzyme MnmG [Bacteroidia bacterium]